MNSTFLKYALLSIISILIIEIVQKALHFDELMYSSLSENLTPLQVEKLIGFQKKWKWGSYTIIPIFLLLKTTIITLILQIGLFFKNEDLKYKILWNLVIKAELIFLLVSIFKIIWFTFFQTKYDLNDLQNFYPLSALNITGYKGLETWFIYPFQILNLFELTYIIYLGFQIGKLTNTNADYGLKIVGLSYVPALILWVATVMFFTLNYS